jgi:DNA-binding HxlR family transcriptional regulator
MTKTQKKAGAAPGRPAFILPLGAVREVEGALKQLGGKWKMIVLFHLFTEPVLNLPELQAVVPGPDQIALLHQLRELERDGLIQRSSEADAAEAQYVLTSLGKGLRPALSQLREWAVLRRVQM